MMDEATDYLVAAALAIYRYTRNPLWQPYIPFDVRRFNKACEDYVNEEQRHDTARSNQLRGGGQG